MSSQTAALRVAGTIFGLMCVAQLARFLARVQIVVAGHTVPLWPSAVAIVVLGGLSAWMWKASCGGGK